MYEAKRKDHIGSFWNDQLDMPAMGKLLKNRVCGKRVLDLGCSVGMITKKLGGWGANVIGADISAEMIAIAVRRIPACPFVVANAEQLPFKDGRFDFVVCDLLIHYLRDLTMIFRECHRVLSASGQLVFSCHHPIAEVSVYPAGAASGAPSLRPYFHDDPYTWKMAQKMELISFHHTFENIVQALHQSGFVVAELLETRPRAAAEAISSKDYLRTSRYPSFCAIRALKFEEK